MMRAKRSFVQWCQWWLLRQHPDPAKTMMGPRHCWPHLENFQQGYSDLEVPFYSRMAIPTLRWCLNFCSICSSLVPWLSWQWVGDLPISILLQLILLDNNKNVQEQCWSVVLAKKHLMMKRSGPPARPLLMATSGQVWDDWGLQPHLRFLPGRIICIICICLYFSSERINYIIKLIPLQNQSILNISSTSPCTISFHVRRNTVNSY